ncbi:MAG: nucleotidyl transferase AbiEii/AbiGii toxin family protein [Phycisphaerales bacterium]|nr:nucleotidyl transferase AbiEii/AbiGii toxin family protein [Phycisphaerales bacterium]
MSHHTNLVRIKGVYNALGSLGDSVAFVGGATVSLYADNPEKADVRPTDDIDVLIEIGTYGDYIKIQDKLFELGFELDIESKVTCRFQYQGLTVDVMPTNENVLGFSNQWYKEGFENIISYTIDEYTKVNIFTAPYFIASKLEAFKGRGKNDGRTSQDFEDIIFVLDHNKKIWEQMTNSSPELIIYLKEECKNILDNQHHMEWISGHLEYESASVRARLILESMKNFVDS